MNLRSCDSTHFIQTISRGLLIKLHNTESHGSPAIVYKSLKDVYENENTRLQRSFPDLVLDSAQVKLKDFPVVDRTLQEIKPEPDEFVCYAEVVESSELDDNTTLKQLRKRFSTKKRKRNGNDENFHLDNVNEGPVEDDDLYEPLIKLKLKCSRTSTTRRKYKNSSVCSSSNVDFSVKAEQSCFPKNETLHFAGQVDQVTLVKIEVLDTEQLESQKKTSSVDNSFKGYNEVVDSGGSASNEYQEMVQHEHTDQQPNNHLEDVQPISMLVPLDGTNAVLETLEGCEDFLNLPSSVIGEGEEIEGGHFCKSSMSQDKNSDVSSYSECSSNMNVISEPSSSSDIPVPDMTREAEEYPCQQDSFLNVADTKSGSFPESIILLQNRENVISAEATTSNEEQPLTQASDGTTKKDLNSEVQIGDETDVLRKDEEKQTSASSISEAVSQSSLKDQSYESSETLPSLEQHPSPERLLSTRKAMSPSSQERLCMVMNSIELGSDADLDMDPDCKSKFFGKRTRKKASIVRSDLPYNISTDGHTRPELASPLKVIISPRIVKKRSKITKGTLEGPHFSRTLPNFSTGCTSIQGCSESAIAFSQRQMHDMESLTEKLMNELKSMKDIVEQKLLFEAYRNNSLKNDADGVKSAINSATKVEDTARKWLSIMSRDCNRFCKIMEMTPNSNSASKDSITREKTITFADEVGGQLFHVKFFGDGDFPDADEIKQ